MNFETLAKNYTLEQVEEMYANGIVSQDNYEHYCYHWRNSSFKFSSVCSGFNSYECPFCGQLFDPDIVKAN